MKDFSPEKRRFLELKGIVALVQCRYCAPIEDYPAHVSGLVGGDSEPSESLVLLFQLVLEKNSLIFSPN